MNRKTKLPCCTAVSYTHLDVYKRQILDEGVTIKSALNETSEAQLAALAEALAR